MIVEKIVNMMRVDDFTEFDILIRLQLESGAKVNVTSAFVHDWQVRSGGYFIQKDDGTVAYSPTKPNLLVPKPTLDFGGALQELKAGNVVSRSGWNGKGMWLKLQVPDQFSKMSLPYIYMKTADNQFVPWLASQTDVLAEDWVVTRA